MCVAVAQSGIALSQWPPRRLAGPARAQREATRWGPRARTRPGNTLRRTRSLLVRNLRSSRRAREAIRVGDCRPADGRLATTRKGVSSPIKVRNESCSTKPIITSALITNSYSLSLSFALPRTQSLFHTRSHLLPPPFLPLSFVHSFSLSLTHTHTRSFSIANFINVSTESNCTASNFAKWTFPPYPLSHPPTLGFRRVCIVGTRSIPTPRVNCIKYSQSYQQQSHRTSYNVSTLLQ